MPPKLRELIAELERAGFVNRGGKGSHRSFVHITFRLVPEGSSTVETTEEAFRLCHLFSLPMSANHIYIHAVCS
jgi:hypothetical protein